MTAPFSTRTARSRRTMLELLLPAGPGGAGPIGSEHGPPVPDHACRSPDATVMPARAPLDAVIAAELDTPVAPWVTDAAARLAAEDGRAAVVLFYGSNLRSGSAEGVLDFYLLTRTSAERGLWPRVSYREYAMPDVGTVRVKVAAMSLARFVQAARGERLDTTVWARFAQPARLIWHRDDAARATATAAVADAVATAARFAAALGPASGTAHDYWRALFRATYRAELRVERPGREGAILDPDPARWDRMLRLAWTRERVAFVESGGSLTPGRREARQVKRWRRRRLAGRPLNVARLVRAAFTFDGAARYGLWKVERHTGVRVPLTPWRERHPVLAAPAVFWAVWRARRRATVDAA